MAYIATISPRQATGDLGAAYRELAGMLGGDRFIARVVQVFSLRAGSMRRMMRGWEIAMWMGSEPRARRELLASLVSRLNDCHY
jgi:hypothetical protein